MGFSAENIRRVSAQLQDMRQKAHARAEHRKQTLHEVNTELAWLDRELSAMGADICLAAIGGDEEKIAVLREKNLALQKKRVDILRTMGLPADYTAVTYCCADCCDTGYTDAGMCACMRRMLIHEGFRSSGLGKLIETQSFDNFSLHFYGEASKDMQKNLEVARQFAEDFEKTHQNLFLFGGTGLGKTHLSTAIARRVIERGFDVVYETAQNILSDFQFDRFEREHGGESKSERYFTCDLLIIDDLGTEVANQFTLSSIYNLINTRLNGGKSILINSNLGHHALLERYDERITSRLLGEFFLFRFQGTDIRRQKAVTGR